MEPGCPVVCSRLVKRRLLAPRALSLLLTPTSCSRSLTAKGRRDRGAVPRPLAWEVVCDGCWCFRLFAASCGGLLAGERVLGHVAGGGVRASQGLKGEIDYGW